MSNRLDKDREEKLQPKRKETAVKEIEERGYKIITQSRDYIRFNYNGSDIRFYPYSGWATGKTIKDGRGLKNLLDQLEISG